MFKKFGGIVSSILITHTIQFQERYVLGYLQDIETTKESIIKNENKTLSSDLEQIFDK